eukprot:GILI01035450.1.p1 GENE.GILI01035450.1~~GILI01035450.1.p1  ORF type:complete len:280 (-),score=25.01 GILI01035450.1:35-841(-)
MVRTKASIPTQRLAKALLPYSIRNCTAKEMMYGGVRVQGLVQQPPNLTYHSSEVLGLPTPASEMGGMKLDYSYTSVRMMPLNVGHQNKYEMSIIRNQDVYERFLKRNRATAGAGLTMNGTRIDAVGLSSSTNGDGQRTEALSNLEARKALLGSYSRKMYHVSRKELSILGADCVGTPEEATRSQVKEAVPTMGSEVFGVGGEAFMPFQMVKPVQHTFSPAQRTSGLTNPGGRLKQELLDRKGFGWQKKQRGLWNQHPDTKGYHPDRFY